MIPGRFCFDAESHRYLMVGKSAHYEVPGITELLKASGYISERYFTVYGRERGSLTHELIEAILLGTVDVNQLTDTQVSGYVLAAVRFMDEVRPKVKSIEECVVSRRLGFATKIDVLGKLGGQPMVLNWKTGAPKRADEIQSALEVVAVDGKRTDRVRAVCYLKKSGKYKLREHLNIGDYAAAGEAIDQWRRTHYNPKRHPPLRFLQPTSSVLG